MAVGYRHPRGTRAALTTLAAAEGLQTGQVYLLTDENRLVVATSSSTFVGFLKEGEGGGGGGGGSPAGADRAVQFNDAGTFGGASKVAIGPAGNLVLMGNSSQPPTPPEGSVQLYGRARNGRVWPELQQPNGREFPFQPHFGLNAIGIWSPLSSSTVSVVGLAISSQGTVSTPTVTPGSLIGSMRRWRVTSATTANAVAETRANANACHRGTAPGLGGFQLVMRFSLQAVPALARGFFGLRGSTGAFSALQTIESMAGIVGLGFTQGTDENLQVYHNDEVGTASKIDTGFPISNLNAVYTLFIYCTPFGNSIFVRVVEELSGVSQEWELTTEIPAPNSMLSPRLAMNNGGTAAACSFECARMYLESDN